MHFVELEFLRRNEQENSEYFQVSLTSCAGTTRYARRELFCPKLQHFLSFKYIEMQPRRSKWQVYCFLIISIQWCHTDEFKRKRKRGIIEYGFSHSLWSAQGTSCQRKGLKFLVSFFLFFFSREIDQILARSNELLSIVWIHLFEPELLNEKNHLQRGEIIIQINYLSPNKFTWRKFHFIIKWKRKSSNRKFEHLLLACPL